VDHEETPSIHVTVRAEDSGSPPLASLALLHVLIEDVNDNSPVWHDFPAEVWVSAGAKLLSSAHEIPLE
jgi:hypothetical protein